MQFPPCHQKIFYFPCSYESICGDGQKNTSLRVEKRLRPVAPLGRNRVVPFRRNQVGPITRSPALTSAPFRKRRGVVRNMDACTPPSISTQPTSSTSFPTNASTSGSFSERLCNRRDVGVKCTRLINPLPADNAEIGMTIASWGLQRTLGKSGRSRTGGEFEGRRSQALAEADSRVDQSAISANGLRTVMKTQVLGSHVCVDAAGFLGRTVGLE
jgi:hypothetical protein